MRVDHRQCRVSGVRSVRDSELRVRPREDGSAVNRSGKRETLNAYQGGALKVVSKLRLRPERPGQ